MFYILITSYKRVPTDLILIIFKLKNKRSCKDCFSVQKHTVLCGIPWVTSSIYLVAIETISKETEERRMGISGAGCVPERNE